MFKIKEDLVYIYDFEILYLFLGNLLYRKILLLK